MVSDKIWSIQSDKTFSFKIKAQAKTVFLSDVEKIVGFVVSNLLSVIRLMTEIHLILCLFRSSAVKILFRL